mgnify:CR=1 FL=1|tara:strand:+ start:8739 stop:9026 length:288 start_codon:yes stop_codon:yes gene_type:complete
MTWILTKPSDRVNKLIKATNNGKIFSATFEKKDGTLRTINCRRAVKKGVKGIGMSFDPMSKGLMVVYDMHKQKFRMINLNKLIEAKANGITIKFM